MLLTEAWENIDQWYGDAVTEFSDVGRDGQSLKFTALEGERRSELVPKGNGLGIDDLGYEEYWFGFSIYIPFDMPDCDAIVWQIHGVPNEGDPTRNPNAALFYAKGKWTFNIRSDNTQSSSYLGQVKKGAWTDFIIQSIWSYNDDGLMRVHVDGYGGDSEKITINGANAYDDLQGRYMKMGLYLMSPAATDISVCNDEIRVFKGQYGNDSVKPRGFR